MTVTIQLFGPLADLLRTRALQVELPAGAPPSVALVLQQLAWLHPAARDQILSARLAVNCTFAAADQVVRPQDELALIGMVSGG
jgi:molybdopterin converting factor small subunit